MMNNDLQFFTVQVKETLLSIHAQQNLREKALKAVLKYRADIEEYINRYPEFLISFQPLPFQEAAPEIVKEMLLAAREVSVGPMAAVAGSIAESVGRDLLPFSPEIIVGNGGDIFIVSKKIRKLGMERLKELKEKGQSFSFLFIQSEKTKKELKEHLFLVSKRIQCFILSLRPSYM